MNRTLHIQARLLWPVSSRPVENGALLIAGGVVQALGPAAEVARPADAMGVDLGEVVLLPGLVNAHCHLDYTHMAGQIAPTSSFTDWIKCITTFKNTWTLDDFRASWSAGAAMLVRRGVTLVGDVEVMPELLPDVWHATPLRGISFLEMTGVKSRRDPEAILREALAKAEGLEHPRWRTGLSPHAPYSTTPVLLRRSAEVARLRGWRVTTHVAESAEEYEMFMGSRGTMYEWLARNERDMTDCGGLSPVQHLERQGLLGDNLLAVHANVLHPGDAELLARRGTHVVHCPRSHSYFEHRPFARPGLERAGVNVCLGTDSMATVRKQPELLLDLFAEMRELLANSPGLSPDQALRMATVNGARALGCAGQAGALFAGGWADAVAVPFKGAVEDAAEAIVQHTGDIAASLIGGAWAMEPPT